MAIRGTGSLAISEISSEFGGDVPHGLSEYYADGVYLSKGYFPNAPAIPSKGDKNTLNVSSFYNRAKRISIIVTISSNLDTNTLPSKSIFEFFKRNTPNISTLEPPVDCFLIIESGVTVYGGNDTTDYVLDVTGKDETRTTGFKSVDTLTIINRGRIRGNGQPGGEGGLGPNLGGNFYFKGKSPTAKLIRALIINGPVRIENYGQIASGGSGGKGGDGGELVVTETKKVCTTTYPCVSYADLTCYGWACDGVGVQGGHPRCLYSWEGAGWNDACHGCNCGTCQSSGVMCALASRFNNCRGSCKSYGTERSCRQCRERTVCKSYYDGGDNAWVTECARVLSYRPCTSQTTVVGEPCNDVTTTNKINTRGGIGGSGDGGISEGASSGGKGNGGTSPNIATDGEFGGQLGATDAIVGYINITNYSTMNIDGGTVKGAVK